MLKVVETGRCDRVSPADPSSRSLLDEIAREGVRRMLPAALRAEADTYVDALVDQDAEDGHRLVVRNGHHKPRTVTTEARGIGVRVPWVHDKRVDESAGERRPFASLIPSAWCRRSPKISDVREQWRDEQRAFARRALPQMDYVDMRANAGSKTAGPGMANKLIVVAQDRW